MIDCFVDALIVCLDICLTFDGLNVRLLVCLVVGFFGWLYTVIVCV